LIQTSGFFYNARKHAISSPPPPTCFVDEKGKEKNKNLRLLLEKKKGKNEKMK
jgi:hypothetical protein